MSIKLIVFVSFTLFVGYLGFLGNQPEKQAGNAYEYKARNTVNEYLHKNHLEAANLIAYQSKAKPPPDYAYIYRSNEKCIEFIVYCHGNECNQLRKYPYHEHGENCPL